MKGESIADEDETEWVLEALYTTTHCMYMGLSL